MRSPSHSPDGEYAWRDDDEVLRVMVEHTPDYAFVLLDEQNHVLRWNTGAERIFGYTEAEILSAPASLFFIPEDRAKGAVENELTTAQRDGKAEDDRGTSARMAPGFGAMA